MENKKEVLLEFSMTPLDKGESVSHYVSRSLEIIEESDISYRLNPMGTCIEGSWDEVFDVVKSCFNKMREDCNRVSVNIKVDYRKGKSGRLESKIRSVEKKLGKELSK